MGRSDQDTGDEKPRMTRKGAKSRKCRNDERKKRKKQNRMWSTTVSRKETE